MPRGRSAVARFYRPIVRPASFVGGFRRRLRPCQKELERIVRAGDGAQCAACDEPAGVGHSIRSRLKVAGSLACAARDGGADRVPCLRRPFLSRPPLWLGRCPVMEEMCFGIFGLAESGKVPHNTELVARSAAVLQRIARGSQKISQKTS